MLWSLGNHFKLNNLENFATSTALCNVPPLLNMGRKYYVIGSVLGSFAIAYLVDHYVADKKIFGGTTPRTTSKEWWEETERKFDKGWPRTVGSPVVMNPISRQNFIVKERVEP